MSSLLSQKISPNFLIADTQKLANPAKERGRNPYCASMLNSGSITNIILYLSYCSQAVKYWTNQYIVKTGT
jgi:hypothetical protein